MGKRLFFLLTFLSLSFYLFSGTTGKIVGIVKDKNTGEPLIGVNVLVEGTPLGSTTDIDGSYLILNVPPGTYTLTFQYIGYREVHQSGVKVSVDFTTTVNVEMEEATIELGEAIVVVAKRDVIRKDLTSSQVEVTADDISTIPSENFDDILQLQSGITRDAGGGFHIRGGRSSEVAYWVDGVTITDAFDGSNGVEIENNAIQSLQVISGTFNAEYGQAMSGIINIVTKEGGEKFSGRISSYVGDYVTGDTYGKDDPFDPNRTDQIYLNLDDINPADIYNLQGSLSGPVPLTSGKMRFFVNFRRFFDEGWLYGQRRYVPTGDTTTTDEGFRVYIPKEGDGAFVPMNFNSWYTGQANISYQVTNLIKLKATFNYENKRFKEYDHFWKYNPDGDLKKFQHGFNTTITLDHTLSSTTFYTVKYAYFKKDFKQYVYEDPTDPRYVNPNAAAFAVPAFTFGVGGQKNQHFNRNTQTHIGKFDITSQVSKNHLMKAGFEIRLHRLFYQDFNVIDIDQTDDELFTPGIPSDTSTNFNQYTFKPVEYSFYVQDKMEYEDFIVNIGLRFDYFDSKGRILRDPKDPNIRSPFLPEHQQMSLAEREQIWYDKPSPKLQLSPRVGVAYPITARGVIHFSYGHFLQIPEFRLLYQNPQFNVTRDRKKDNLVGNADLDAQRTVMYEIGLQQQLSDDISIDVTGYYRDIRGWVGTSPLIETYDNSTFYSQYENRDYANVRGVTLMFRKRFANHFSANLDYTFQVAEGNASDPEDAFNDIKNDKEPRKTIIPLNWDRRHVLNGNVYLGFGGNGISVLARLETGLPYTPQPATGVRVGTNVPQGLRENSGRRPTLFTVDLQLYRDIKFKVGNSEFKWTLFAKIYNLLDRRNEQNVYSDTGRATYTITSGAFADPEYIVRPDFYTQPRRVQLGFSWEF